MNGKQEKSTLAFMTLLKAGLWEQDVQLLPFGEIDFKEVYRLAQEQSVVGLIAAGLEHILDVKVPKDIALSFVGDALQMEQRNVAMNRFISELYVKLKQEGVVPVLVKGQGVAQCYERSLWRASGDIDLFLDANNYDKAKSFLLPLATKVAEESPEYKHFAMTINQWEVELHGTLRSGSLPRKTNFGYQNIVK